ncbi:hypothetical protein B0T18DRAFT_392306 [Schizothecium vesticola]|uniref:Uncharacterized protein n=1 Tax=Schizothecium vesticola TaxID=314040 RepID=A0AA40K2J5_9PEZI|nr:hypothetical protein B0T18DRAFT_392306 [Schizothecium vesticola]
MKPSPLFSIACFMAYVVSASPRPDQAIGTRQSYIGVACTNTVYSNVYGTCQTTSTCSSRTGLADTNPDCPGPDNVQCCILDDCVNGASGTCLDTRQWNCRGSGGWNSGNHCPGPVVEKTWFLMHPSTTTSPNRHHAVAPPTGFEEACLPPDNNPRSHPKYHLVQAPPFLRYESLKEGVHDIPSPLHALVEFVLDNLEEQFHAGIQELEISIPYIDGCNNRAELEKQAAYENEPAAKKKGAFPSDANA